MQYGFVPIETQAFKSGQHLIRNKAAQTRVIMISDNYLIVV